MKSHKFFNLIVIFSLVWPALLMNDSRPARAAPETGHNLGGYQRWRYTSLHLNRAHYCYSVIAKCLSAGHFEKPIREPLIVGRQNILETQQVEELNYEMEKSADPNIAFMVVYHLDNTLYSTFGSQSGHSD